MIDTAISVLGTITLVAFSYALARGLFGWKKWWIR